MLGSIDSRMIEKTMKRMGISQTPLDARRVIIELEDKNIVIDEPSVTKIIMQGNESFQISGESREEEKEGFSDKDVELVMEKTGKEKEEARRVLKENGGDVAGAILDLK